VIAQVSRAIEYSSGTGWELHGPFLVSRSPTWLDRLLPPRSFVLDVQYLCLHLEASEGVDPPEAPADRLEGTPPPPAAAAGGGQLPFASANEALWSAPDRAVGELAASLVIVEVLLLHRHTNRG
jgi:hypothetical protein